MEANNRRDLNIILRDFKQPNGAIFFPALFAIDSSRRIAKMAKENLRRVTALITVAITAAMEVMNLARPMNANQILDLVDFLIDSSEEDNLSLEDLMLFLQKFSRGEYGPFYEGMDIPKFMEKFEQYREHRHRALVQIRQEQAAQHRTYGDSNRNGINDPLSTAMDRIAGVLNFVKTDAKNR